MKRKTLSLRQKTKISQKLPAEYHDKIIEFQKYIIKQRTEKDFSMNLIGNMDETPMCFDMPYNTTVDKKGQKTIMIKTTGHEKTHFTVVLACMANGDKLSPMVIFKRKLIPKEKFPAGVVIHVHPKGWMDEEGVILWINKVWSRIHSSLSTRRKPALLVWDQFRSHLTDLVKKRLKVEETTQAVIPGGLTGMLQSLDVCLNKPFKAKMRALWHA